MIKKIGIRALFLFIVSFILTLPFEFNLIPKTGILLKPFIESIVQTVFSDPNLVFYSDSFVMLFWTLTLIGFSVLFGLIWVVVQKRELPYLPFWINRIAIYYLALILLIYGLNKVFLFQFYIPEPNILYTPLGQLSPDILYWSSMGSSSTYSIFAGSIEILPAILILFRRTRLLGAFIAFGVLFNILFINWGFGITVKTFTYFLLLLSILVLFPYFKRLRTAFFGEGTIASVIEFAKPQHPIYQKSARSFHAILLVFIVSEALMPYIKTRNFNGRNQEKPYLFGAYEVSPNPNEVKRVFFHSASYFILQTKSDEFFDYAMNWNGAQLELIGYEEDTTYLTISSQNDSMYTLSGNFYGTFVNWEMKQLNLESLPFFQN